ncbi:hypothetical protein ACE7GA_01910 [Roseomonas sp. CCTCC AB2023176]
MLRSLAFHLPALAAPGHAGWRRMARDAPATLGLLGVTLFALVLTGFIAP